MSWYFVDPEGGTKGPMDISQLKPLYGTEITETTYLWNGINIQQWTELNKIPSLYAELSGEIRNAAVNADGLTPDDIDDILDEIDSQNKNNMSAVSDEKEENEIQKEKENSKKQSKPRKSKPKTKNNKMYSINWREIYLHRQSILNLVQSGDIDIDVQNPSDGMTLLMHSIIIGDFNLCVIIINYGADIFIRDNDGDDALDYALVFQRYKVTQLLLVLGFLRNKNEGIEEAIAYKNKQAKYMMQQQFGRLKEKIIQFVTKAIREKECFDINLLYFAWYFTVNMKEFGHGHSSTSPSSTVSPQSTSHSSRNKHKHRHKKMIKYNPYQDPLQSKLFKIMMKTYWEIISNKSSDKKGWQWLRKHFINSLIWYLPHPHNINTLSLANINININNMAEESDDYETDMSDPDTNDSNESCSQEYNIKTILSQIADNSDKMLFFLFL